MRNIRSLSLMALAAGTLVLAGCATEGYPNSYNGYSNAPGYSQGYPSGPVTRPAPGYAQDYYNPGYVRYGTVYNLRTVPVQTGTSGAGVAIGGVGGAVLGNQIGRGSGRTAATVLGAVGGAVLGNEIEKRNYRTVQGVELQIEVDGTREMITVTQPEQGQNFRIGSRVRLTEQNGRWVASY